MDTISIFQISFYLSFLGMAFIFLRNLPKIAEYKVKYIPKEKRISFKIKRNISEGKIKTIHKTHKIQEKLAHRLRVLILKIDNFLFNWLKNVKEKKFHIENIYFRKPKEKLIEKRPVREKAKRLLRKKRG